MSAQSYEGHTPGPWMESDFGGDRILIHCTDAYGSVSRVAVVYFGSSLWSSAHEANARLIAAAPQLLADKEELIARNAALLDALSRAQSAMQLIAGGTHDSWAERHARAGLLEIAELLAKHSKGAP